MRSQGVSVKTRFFRVGFLSAQEKKLGLVVGKKLGTAVTRNRLKRRVREHFRKYRELYPQGDCVIIPQNGAENLVSAEFLQKLEQALSKLKQELGEL